MLSPYKPVCIISISFVRRTKQNAFLSVSGFLDALLHLRFLSTLPASYTHPFPDEPNAATYMYLRDLLSDWTLLCQNWDQPSQRCWFINAPKYLLSYLNSILSYFTWYFLQFLYHTTPLYHAIYASFLLLRLFLSVCLSVFLSLLLSFKEETLMRIQRWDQKDPPIEVP